MLWKSEVKVGDNCIFENYYKKTKNMKEKKQQQEDDNQFNMNLLYASELEKAVLGTLMTDKKAYALISDILCPESFYEHRHQLIYAAIIVLAVNQMPIDILTVKEQLSKQGELDKIGGASYIIHLSSKVASSSQTQYHARIIAQKYISRQLLALATDIRLKVFDETQDVEDLISEIRGKLTDISSLNTEHDCIQINPVIDEAYKLIQKAATRTDGLSGLESGFTRLDKMTSGWQNGDLITIGARPAMGKTAFIISMLRNMAVNFRIPVALFSLEMNNVQLVNRLITNVCEIPSEKIKSGQLACYEWQQLDYKLKDLQDAPLYVDDSPLMKMDVLCNKAHYLVKEKGVKLIAIDYVQLLYNDVKYTENRYSEINYFTRRLKSLAKELNIPIIITSQLNRAIESREGIDAKRPQLIDLRDSGTLCDDSDLILFLHRPEYYKNFQDDRGNDMRGMAEIIIAKHRNGAVGEILLRFKGEFCRFSNLEEDMCIPMPGEPIGTMFGSSSISKTKAPSSKENQIKDEGPLPF